MMTDNYGCLIFTLFILFMMAFYPAQFILLFGAAVIFGFIAQIIGMFMD